MKTNIQPIFQNKDERNAYLRDLPFDELQRLAQHYDSLNDQTRVPYAQWLLDGIKDEIIGRHM